MKIGYVGIENIGGDIILGHQRFISMAATAHLRRVQAELGGAGILKIV